MKYIRKVNKEVVYKYFVNDRTSVKVNLSIHVIRGEIGTQVKGVLIS